jgi:uncharacterized protein YndB with AHSA1/START domain
MKDRIEKQIVLRAPRSRVWRALVERAEFGSWFGVRFAPGTFAPGEEVSVSITHPGYEHVVMKILIEDVEPETRFSYRWHPYAADPDFDFSGEPQTLVTFTLEDVEGGTLLTLVESGFDLLPETRRAEAWPMNDGGWTEQMKNIERHVTA